MTKVLSSRRLSLRGSWRARSGWRGSVAVVRANTTGRAHDGSLFHTPEGTRMKKMIRMALMAVAMFSVVTTVAKAQGGGGGGRGRGRDPMTIVKDSLKVTDAAILAKVDSIVKAAATESQPLME